MANEPLDHLEEAKRLVDQGHEALVRKAVVHALLSIAESLEVMSFEGFEVTVTAPDGG